MIYYSVRVIVETMNASVKLIAKSDGILYADEKLTYENASHC